MKIKTENKKKQINKRKKYFKIAACLPFIILATTFSKVNAPPTRIIFTDIDESS